MDIVSEKWQVNFTKEARKDLVSFVAEAPEFVDHLSELLVLLCKEDDPRRPQHPALNVRRIEHFGNGNWFRLKIGGRFNHRVIFCLFHRNSRRTLEYAYDDALILNEPQNGIRVSYIARRTNTTYLDAKRRLT